MTSARDERGASWALALACARFAAGLADPDKVRMAAAAVSNWSVAFETVRRHRLLPWLQRAVQRGDLPDEALARVRAHCADAGVRALAQVHVLSRVCTLLHEADIPALPYKGPLLSLQLYGDVGLRDCTDVDLIVRPADYDRARRIVIQSGARPRGGHSARQEAAIFAGSGQAAFGMGDDVMIELHWRIARRQFAFALTPEMAIARAVPSHAGGVSALRMADDDLLVTLAMHGTRHLFERLEWLSGFARLFLSVAPDAGTLIAHADSLRARRMLLVSVAAANEMFGMPLAPDWRTALAANRSCPVIASRLARDLRAEAVESRPLPSGAALQWSYARMTDRSLDRAMLIVRGVLLPTRKEWEVVQLPDGLSPLYHVIRPLRVLAKYAGRALSRRHA